MIGSNLQSNDIFPKVGFVCNIHYTIDITKNCKFPLVPITNLLHRYMHKK